MFQNDDVDKIDSNSREANNSPQSDKMTSEETNIELLRVNKVAANKTPKNNKQTTSKQELLSDNYTANNADITELQQTLALKRVQFTSDSLPTLGIFKNKK